MKIKPAALLFDMDGVLVDSLDSWWKALNDALKAYDHDAITRDEFIETYWGHDLKSNLEKIGLNPEVVTFCNNVYGDHVDSVKIYPGTKETLNSLKAYKKAIITNTPGSCADQILEKIGIKKFFDEVVTSDMVIMGKPNPEIVFKACTLLDVNADKCVLIGDTQSDVEAGRKAGCTVIGIKTKADYNINKISELLEIIEK